MRRGGRRGVALGSLWSWVVNQVLRTGLLVLLILMDATFGLGGVYSWDGWMVVGYLLLGLFYGWMYGICLVPGTASRTSPCVWS